MALANRTLNGRKKAYMMRHEAFHYKSAEQMLETLGKPRIKADTPDSSHSSNTGWERWPAIRRLGILVSKLHVLADRHYRYEVDQHQNNSTSCQHDISRLRLKD